MPNRRWQNGESRKGWRHDTDIGQLLWQQILRGPRPPSVRWPTAQKSHDGRGASAKAQTRRDPPTRRSPEEVVSAAQERVQKLERALEVLGEDSRPEFQVLQDSLKKAKAAAQRVPFVVQLEQSLKFVERSEKRLRVLDEERAKEARLLEEAKQRVARLRSELAAESPHHHPPTVPADYAQELVQLRACVEDCSANGKIFVQSCRCEARGAAVGGAGHCPIHLPIFSRESCSVGSEVNREVVCQCDGDVDRQCGVVSHMVCEHGEDTEPKRRGSLWANPSSASSARQSKIRAR